MDSAAAFWERRSRPRDRIVSSADRLDALSCVEPDPPFLKPDRALTDIACMVERRSVRHAAWLTASIVCLLVAPAQAGAYDYYFVDQSFPGATELLNGDAGGLLTLNASSAPGSSGEEVVIAPDGDYAYIVNWNSAGFTQQFAVGANGVLSALSPASVSGIANPDSLAISPDGGSLYVAQSGGSPRQIQQFDVGSDGKLSAKSPATVVAGVAEGMNAIAVNPRQNAVYATSYGTNSVLQFAIGAGGTLSYMSTPSVAAGTSPQELALTPDGRNLYVGNFGSSTISQYSVAEDGSLSPKSPATVAAAGNPSDVAVSPDGKSFYSVQPSSNLVLMYDIAADGTLAPKATASVAAASGPRSMVVSPDGAHAYVASGGAASVKMYDVDASGVLTPMSTASVATNASGWSITGSPDAGPTASFTASAATAGLASGFDGSDSSGSDSPVASYRWDFGDGTTATTTDATTTHVYAGAGDYTVRLTVANGGGCSTDLIFTGQSPYCAGNPAATTTRSISVPAAPSTPTGPPAQPRPSISELRLSPKSIGAGRRARKLRVTFKSSQAGPASIVVKQSWGRKVGKACRSSRRAVGKRKRCKLDAQVLKSAITSRAGANRATIAARRLRRLAPGSYSVVVGLGDGPRASASASFRIKAPRRR